MTITDLSANSPLAVEQAALETVTFDGYRNIHKGIRRELFGVTEAIGSVDPADDAEVEANTVRLQDLVKLLVSHAEHEDEFVQPHIDKHVPQLAQRIAEDHPRLEAQMARIELLADTAVSSAVAQRRVAVHRLYLGLASFTAEYLQHQSIEELEVTPALSAVMTFDELLAIDMQIVASIPPDELATGLSLMIPAMNVDDRTELLAGIKGSAPAEAFAPIWGLTESVLAPRDFAALAGRLAA